METPERIGTVPSTLQQAVGRGPSEVRHFLAQKFGAVLLAATTEEEVALIRYLWRIIHEEKP